MQSNMPPKKVQENLKQRLLMSRRLIKKLTSVLIYTLWSLFSLWMLSTLLIFLMVRGDWFGWFGSLPSLEKFENPDIEYASLLFSSDGVLLGKYYRENRTSIRYEDLSDPLKETLLATEDIRFFQHSGIDLKSFLRAVLGKLTLRYAGGGSTLTMQLAENLYRTSTENQGSLYKKDKDLGRLITKMKEWIIAIQLERQYTKEEIMAMYLNTIPFGSNAFGIQAAAKTFFNKLPNTLGYHEAAWLTAIINAPTRYSPILNPETASEKYREVLYNLYKHDHISSEALDSLSTLPFERENYRVESHIRGRATYFREIARLSLINWASKHGYDLFGDGLRVYTTLDSRLQRYAEEAVKGHMHKLQKKFNRHWAGRNPWIDDDNAEIEDFIATEIHRTQYYKYLSQAYKGDEAAIEKALQQKKPMRIFSWEAELDTLMSAYDSLAYYKRFLHAGLMSVEPQTGYVKAWVGGINYKYFKFDHVKQGKRQPGSTIKPVVYTAVIDHGYTPCYESRDDPVTFHLPGQDPDTWTPQNAEERTTGRKMTIRQAMARSVNVITAYWMKKMGIHTVIEYAKRIGIRSKLDPVPSLCLGSGGDVSIYEMTGAYGTFVNKGVWTEPIFIQRIEDRQGNIIHEFVPKKVEALSEETAYIMLHMLKGSLEERGGTAQSLSHKLRRHNDIGAKTGTTQNASDGWFFGVTKALVSGVWVGGDNRVVRFRNWTMGQGARTALPIWEAYMLRAYQDPSIGLTRGRFEKPRDPLSISLNCQLYHQETIDNPQEDENAPSLEDIY